MLLLLIEVVVVVVQLVWPSSVCPFAMYVFEDVNENVPSIHRMNCARYALYPMSYTMEIRSIAQISMLMALPRKLMAGSVLMVMLIPYIYDIPDYCRWKYEIKRTFSINRTKQKKMKMNNGRLSYTYCLYFSSDDFSRNGIPDKNKIISVVNSGDKMPIHSIP